MTGFMANELHTIDSIFNYTARMVLKQQKGCPCEAAFKKLWN